MSGLGDWEKKEVGRRTGIPYMSHRVTLPNDVTNWLGLSTPMGSHSLSLESIEGNYDNEIVREIVRDYVAKHGSVNLTLLNDAGISFDEIADIIESEPLGLVGN